MMITTRPLDARGFSLCGASSHRTIVRMRLQVIFPAGTAVEMYDLLRELSFSSDHNTRIRQCRSIPRGAKKLDFVEDERQFDSAEIEEKITSPDSNRKILEELKRRLRHRLLPMARRTNAVLRAPLATSSLPPARLGSFRRFRATPEDLPR